MAITVNSQEACQREGKNDPYYEALFLSCDASILHSPSLVMTIFTLVTITSFDEDGQVLPFLCWYNLCNRSVIWRILSLISSSKTLSICASSSSRIFCSSSDMGNI